jgi:hypothetical protein
MQSMKKQLSGKVIDDDDKEGVPSESIGEGSTSATSSILNTL